MFTANTETMDSPDHKPDLCPPLEHEDLFSVHPADQAAEPWLSPELILPQDRQSQAINESFQLLPEEPRQLIEPNAQIALQATGILRLWDTYNAKNAEGQHLEKENEALRIANTNLLEQQGQLERHHAEQEALIAYYGRIFAKVRGGIVGLIRDWEGSPGDATSEKVDVIHQDAYWDA